MILEARVPRTISFDSSIYVRAGVDDAVRSYASMAQCSVVEQEGQFIVSLVTEDPENEELIADHFTNHVLFATLSCQGHAS